jgi:hypothetical protein
LKQAIALAPALLLIGCCPPVDGRESPGDKREWSVLQGLEYKTREDRADDMQFRTVEEFEVVGIPRSGAPPIWVMLNPSHPPFYKQMPEGNYTLSANDIQAIVSGHRVTSTVEEVFRSHLPTP